MKPRFILPALLMLCLPIAGLGAQTHLSVDIQDPVYQLLELGELKGALGQLSAVRPFSRSQVVALLDRLWEARNRLSPAERAVLSETRKRLGEERSGLAHGQERSRRHIRRPSIAWIGLSSAGCERISNFIATAAGRQSLISMLRR